MEVVIASRCAGVAARDSPSEMPMTSPALTGIRIGAVCEALGGAVVRALSAMIVKLFAGPPGARP